MNSIYIKYYKTPVGELIIGDHNNRLCLCDWRYRKMREAIDKRLQQGLDANYDEEDTPLIKETIRQLNEYFGQQRTSFQLPLNLIGSAFQIKVWQALQTIPFGQTETYLGLSKRLGNEKAIRAVAGANGANAISIIIPCHRIVGSKGELTGYAGGLAAKKKLLQLENARLFSDQPQLF